MAHFHRMPNGERISEQTLPVAGTSVTIGLWGYLDFAQQELTVTSSDPRIRVTRHTIVGNSRLWIVTGEVGASARLEAFTSYGHRWDYCTVEFRPSATPAVKFGKRTERRNVVLLARGFVGTSHYLWGTAGETPGSSSEIKAFGKRCDMLTPNIDPRAASPENGKCFGIQTAWDHRGGGFNSCAGGLGGRRADRVLDLKLLESYLATVKELIARGTGQITFPSIATRYPRQWIFVGKAKGVYTGDTCVGRRHFDCIGLVWYCYSQYFVTPFTFDQKQIASVSGAVQVTDSSYMDADIIIKLGKNDAGQTTYNHIAMLYLEGSKPKIVQAADSDIGLTDTDDFSPSTSWARFRFPDAMFR